MPDIYMEAPNERIVNVHWVKSVKLVGLQVYVIVATENEGSPPPDPDYSFTISVGGDVVEIMHDQIIVVRGDAVPPAPAVTIPPTYPSLAYYAIFGFLPIDSGVESSESTGGDYYVLLNTIGAYYPDFVPSPYPSVAAAEAYLSAQIDLHPIYALYDWNIDYTAPYDTFRKTRSIRATVYINLDWYGDDTTIGLLGTTTSNGYAMTIDAGLIVGDINYPDTPVSYYAAVPQATMPDVEGNLIVTVDPPSMTGPYFGGGGGEGS